MLYCVSVTDCAGEQRESYPCMVFSFFLCHNRDRWCLASFERSFAQNIYTPCLQTIFCSFFMVPTHFSTSRNTVYTTFHTFPFSECRAAHWFHCFFLSSRSSKRLESHTPPEGGGGSEGSSQETQERGRQRLYIEWGETKQGGCIGMKWPRWKRKAKWNSVYITLYRDAGQPNKKSPGYEHQQAAPETPLLSDICSCWEGLMAVFSRGHINTCILVIIQLWYFVYIQTACFSLTVSIIGLWSFIFDCSTYWFWKHYSWAFCIAAGSWGWICCVLKRNVKKKKSLTCVPFKSRYYFMLTGEIHFK